jgi:hypothetical protein
MVIAKALRRITFPIIKKRHGPKRDEDAVVIAENIIEMVRIQQRCLFGLSRIIANFFHL